MPVIKLQYVWTIRYLSKGGDSEILCTDLSHTVLSKRPFTRYKRFSNRLSNWFDNRLHRVNKHPTGSQTGCTTGLTTGWMFVYTIQPVVQPFVKPV